MTGTPQPLLSVRGLKKRFGTKGVLDAVEFSVASGEAVALVGESGSGKSTIARIIARLTECDEGELLIDGKNVLEDEPRAASLDYRSRVQMVFQDPFASLNPIHTVRHHLIRPLLRHGRCASTEEAERRALEILDAVGLSPAASYLNSVPSELSGGQRQRVAIARALAVEPRLLIADEPTSMLDASVRMGVLSLLNELVRSRGIGLLLITHDLATARLLCDRVLVLHAGRIVEQGPSQDVFASPIHPYTQTLLAALPRGVPREAASVPARKAPSVGGCSWLGRCDRSIEACGHGVPALEAVGGGRSVRCLVRSSSLEEAAS